MNQFIQFNMQMAFSAEERTYLVTVLLTYLLTYLLTHRSSVSSLWRSSSECKHVRVEFGDNTQSSGMQRRLPENSRMQVGQHRALPDRDKYVALRERSRHLSAARCVH